MMNQFWRGRQVWLMLVGTIALTGVSVVAAQQSHPQLNASTAPRSAAVIVADNAAVAALASHLKKIGATMYGAYWCPHCTEQKRLFGAAVQDILYIECDPRGKNPQPDRCQAAGVKGYPTWEINGKTYVGVQTLEELAKASNYKGANNF